MVSIEQYLKSKPFKNVNVITMIKTYMTNYRLPCYPLAWNTKIPFKGTHGRNDATLDEWRIDTWYRRWGNINYGFRLDCLDQPHEPFYYSAIDVDMHETNGYESLQRMFDRGLITLEDINRAIIQRTPSDGMHLIWRSEKPNPTCMLTLYSQEFAGIDLISKGGNLIGAGSVCKNKSYVLVQLPDPFKMGYFPDKVNLLREELTAHKKPYQLTRNTTPKAKISGQGRNTLLTSIGGRLVSRGMDYRTVLDKLTMFNKILFETPLYPREIQTITNSVFRYRKQRS